MLSRNGARIEGHVQELFHEEAQQVCHRAIAFPKILPPHSWSPLWQGNRNEVTKLPFVLLCTSEECDIERERGDLISRGQEEAVAIGKNCSFPGVSDLGSSNSGKPLCPKSQSPTSP